MEFTKLLVDFDTALCGVYVITHIATGIRYVGSAGNVSKRKDDHMYRLRKGTHENKYLQDAFNLNSELKWRLILVENRQEAFDLEQVIQDEYRLMGEELFNIGLDVRHHQIGRLRTEEERRKQSQSCMGRPGYWKGKVIPEDARRKMSAAAKNRLPRIMTEDVISKIRASCTISRGRPVRIKDAIYPSVKEASRALGISSMAIVRKCQSDSDCHREWEYLVSDSH